MRHQNKHWHSILGKVVFIFLFSALAQAKQNQKGGDQPYPTASPTNTSGPTSHTTTTTTDSTTTTSNMSDTTTTGSTLSEKAAKEVRGKTYVEIEFMKDSAVLTDNAKSSIQALVDQAKQAGKVEDVLVLSWADEEYPSTSKKKLSKSQIELAAKRNEAVEDYIKSLTTANVDRYNLAKQPNVFSKWFNTTDARLKNALVAAGLPTSPGTHQYPTKASHSVVIIK